MHGLRKSSMPKSRPWYEKPYPDMGGGVTFGWINWNNLNSQVPKNLPPEAASLFPLLERKVAQLLEASPEPGILQDNAFFCPLPVTIPFIALGITRVYWENTSPTLGGNSLYNQNDYRTRIVSTGNNWKNTCESVSWDLPSGELADPGALSCDLGFSPMDRKSGLVLISCWDGLLKLCHRDVLL